MPKIEISPGQIESWVAKYFDYRDRKGGDELLICNPFDGDTGYHFNISIHKATCHDWRGDGWAGYDPRSGKRRKCTFLRFVMLYLEGMHGRCSFRMALEDVLGSVSSARSILRAQKSKDRLEAKEKASVGLPGGSVGLAESKQYKLVKGIISWLASRGVDGRKIEKYKVMHNGLDIVWPYYEYDELVYWQSRSFIEKRFEFPPESIGATKGEFLYGFDLVEPASHLIIVEAIFCCQTLEEQTVASGGAILTEMQAKKVRVLGPRDGVILAADNDIAGIESILSNASKLKPYVPKIYFALPPLLPYEFAGETEYTKDWNDIERYTDEDAREHFEASVKPLSVRQKMALLKRVDRLRSLRPVNPSSS